METGTLYTLGVVARIETMKPRERLYLSRFNDAVTWRLYFWGAITATHSLV